MKFEIIGRYNNDKENEEVIDEASTQKQAEFLVAEYAMAFGSEWEVWYEEMNQKAS